ncbi:methyltransferase domain-containing protein [Paeniglutamicibacter psychrophenolicus]|uniref:methyltransferase domain-containing protein n=1 Tax=Paeniglutamicibacter psychrophenolicus TaxID=257454 RepID=UPI00278785EA|nr:methyltransferase domain-containing protein [Paeniglutamicibacter psychrophenolicus]MDQ0092432.1 2-polyprenyl-3-methyl-5-hydroxy-6-metoxy-1,4-benzoquinol methylase [Paeniglutamicibacter psychrophenolicus]
MQRDISATEEMERPDADPALLERTYAQFRLVNLVVSGWRGVYVRLVRPQLPRRGTGTILDIGCGGGDLALALLRWARADGYEVRVLGIDPDARAHDFSTRAAASAGPGEPGIEFRRTTSSVLVAEGARFDVVVSNHVLHHLDPPQLAGVLADSQHLARGLSIHSDIRRRRSALLLFGLATLPLAGSSFIRRDGLTSIRRSYTPGELARVLPPGWHAHTQGQYRNLAIWRAEARMAP